MIFNAIIPLPIYTAVFYNVMLLLVVASFIKLSTKKYYTKTNNTKEYASIFLLLILFFYMGLRPISGRYFGDMFTYAVEFNQYVNGGRIEVDKDYFWKLFMKFCSGYMTVTTFFVVCAFLYVTPLYYACKNWFGTKKYIPFLMVVASLSFWSYGTNGIRNGIATSIFLFALSIDKKYIKYGLFYLAISIHGSLLILILTYIITIFYKNPKYYLIAWFTAIPLSLALGGFWENFFASLGFGGDRIHYLTDSRFQDQFSSTGFRLDFVLYSASAVFAGYYFIFKKKFKDKAYHQLFNMYLTANAFWILVIRASFSNRFAYLSWFMMAIIIFYPFVKEKLMLNQNRILAYIVFIYFGFTYFMAL